MKHYEGNGKMEDFAIREICCKYRCFPSNVLQSNDQDRQSLRPSVRMRISNFRHLCLDTLNLEGTDRSINSSLIKSLVKVVTLYDFCFYRIREQWPRVKTDNYYPPCLVKKHTCQDLKTDPVFLRSTISFLVLQNVT